MSHGNRRTRAVCWRPGALPGPVTVGRGRRAVRLEVTAIGRDLLVTLTGGQAHAGAVALAGPAGSPGAAGLVVLPPHKEGPLAQECAEAVAAAAGCACVVAAGIHQDGATPQEIAAIVSHARQAIAHLAAELGRVPPAQRYCSARLPKPSTP